MASQSARVLSCCVWLLCQRQIDAMLSAIVRCWNTTTHGSCSQREDVRTTYYTKTPNPECAPHSRARLRSKANGLCRVSQQQQLQQQPASQPVSQSLGGGNRTPTAHGNAVVQPSRPPFFFRLSLSHSLWFSLGGGAAAVVGSAMRANLFRVRCL